MRSPSPQTPATGEGPPEGTAKKHPSASCRLTLQLSKPNPVTLNGVAAEGAHQAPDDPGDGVVPDGEAEESGHRLPVEAHAAVPQHQRLQQPHEQKGEPDQVSIRTGH